MKPMYHSREFKKYYDIFIFNDDHNVINSKRVLSTEQGAYTNALIYQEQLKGSYFQVLKVVARSL